MKKVVLEDRCPSNTPLTIEVVADLSNNNIRERLGDAMMDIHEGHHTIRLYGDDFMWLFDNLHRAYKKVVGDF